MTSSTSTAHHIITRKHWRLCRGGRGGLCLRVESNLTEPTQYGGFHLHLFHNPSCRPFCTWEISFDPHMVSTCRWEMKNTLHSLLHFLLPPRRVHRSDQPVITIHPPPHDVGTAHLPSPIPSHILGSSRVLHALLVRHNSQAFRPLPLSFRAD